VSLLLILLLAWISFAVIFAQLYEEQSQGFKKVFNSFSGLLRQALPASQ